MRFTSFWPLAFLSFIPIIILMYLLKQKVEDKVISSTFLWTQVYKNREASTPWEKFKKNILMFLQILIVMFLIFSLMDPFLKIGGKEYKNVIFVLDTTASMKSYDGESTRFEEGIKKAEKLINSIKGDANVYIITSGNSTKIEISNSKDKALALNKLKSIKPKDVTGTLEDSISLVKAIAKQEESYEAIFITDKTLEVKDINATVINLGNTGKNASIDVLAHKIEKEKLKVMVKVTNRGDENYSSDVNLYGNDKLLDVKNVTIKPKESKTLYFDDMDFKGEVLKAELSEWDILKEDNVAYDVIEPENTQRILLVTEKNIFLEKALNTISDAEVYKTNSVDNINEEDNYDLYIFDGMMPENLPKEGNFIIINPGENKLFKVGTLKEGMMASTEQSEVTRYMENLKFGVKEYKDLELPNWGKSFMKVDNGTLAFIGKYENRKIAVFGFDFHKSDFILKPEFPILIHNLMNEVINRGMLYSRTFIGGEEVEINALPDGEDIKIKTPEEEIETIALRFPLKNFKNTEKVGVYEVSQKKGDNKTKVKFAVNFPTEGESNVFKGEEQDKSNTKDLKNFKGGLNLKVYGIILAIIILCVEWFIYAKGY